MRVGDFVDARVVGTAFGTRLELQVTPEPRPDGEEPHALLDRAQALELREAIDRFVAGEHL